MKIYTHRTRIKATIEQVEEFHRDSRALSRLSPPLMFVRFNKVEPLGEASIVDFVMWLGPLPIHWVAVHSGVSPSGFTDTQKVGPFKFWKHTHHFVAIEENLSEVVDEIYAELGDHPFWGVVSRVMWINLPILFAYRGWITRRSLEGKLH